MQKDTRKEASDNRSSFSLRHEREGRCIIQRTRIERTGYGKRSLFLQTLLARESGAAVRICRVAAWTPVYIDRDPTEIKRSGKCKGRVLANNALL